MRTAHNLFQVLPVFLLLGIAAEYKLFQGDGNLSAQGGEVAVAISLFATTFFIGRRCSAAIGFLLFTGFGFFHLFHLFEEEYSCGCFGEGVYSPSFMAAGCIFVAVSQLVFVINTKASQYLSRIVLFFAIVALGGTFLYLGKVSSTDERNNFFDFCDFVGSSIPFLNWNDIEQDLKSPDRLIILNRNCKKCQILLAEAAIDIEPFMGYRYLAIIYSGGNGKATVYGLRSPVVLNIEVPRMIEIRNGLLVGCSSIEQPNGKS